MTVDEQICFESIEALAPRLRRGEISPVELLTAVLARVERLQPRLNAFITVMGEAALAEARIAERELAAGRWRGPLHGVPISVKDLYDTAGVRTTCGSRVLADRVPERDSPVVARLKTAGAIVFGKNMMSEFAYGAVHPDFGPARNPWNTAYSAAGSSSGSGAAVAAGLGPGSMGSDTGGSIRLPAAFCGIVGLKPSAGLVSRAGVMPLSWTLDCCGPITRTVWDCAALLQAVAGYDPADPGSIDRPTPDMLADIDAGVNGLRVGVLQNERHELDPEVAGAFALAETTFAQLGAELRPVTLPDLPTLSRTNYAIVTAEAGAIHRAWFRERPSDYSDGGHARIEAGLSMLAVDLLQAQRDRPALTAQVLTALAEVDVLLMPVSDGPPLTVEDYISPMPIEGPGRSLARRGLFTSPFNLTGLPAVSLPAGFTASRLPLAIQLVGQPWADATLLRAARAYERAINWPAERPPI